jgi:hypothetical protein
MEQETLRELYQLPHIGFLQEDFQKLQEWFEEVFVAKWLA